MLYRCPDSDFAWIHRRLLRRQPFGGQRRRSRAAARKLRDLQLKAGHATRRGQRGSAYAYNLTSVREEERRWVEQAEKAYERFVAGWQPHGPKARPGAAKEER
jgi:hypothetical protein